MGEAAGDYSDGSVSISSEGSFVAIGSDSNDGNGTNSGHVRVFQIQGLLDSDLVSEVSSNLTDYFEALNYIAS